ncbi:SH3 domain-containing protein [Woeseia oceani]|uniref:SH3b domain-containing protein n=1 Tax=Woeseia oceani TaxID=1548547 RepID=A0A193LC69_9GAMM|nr:SH3 domain-containing protein [Woeseia oceani]ANO50063.1 hypothetical protein BA177_01450 [Woeseia oceani]
MIDNELKAIDQALRPQRLLQEQLDHIFEPQRRLQEQFEKALATYGTVQEQFERAFEPQRRLQKQFDKALAPYGTVREQLDRAFAPQRRLREQLDGVFAPYRRIQEEFERYFGPLESYLNENSIADIEVGDDGSLVVSGEAVTSDEINSALVDFPREHSDPEEFYAQLFQKLQSVSARVSRAIVFLLVTYILSVAANLTTPVYQEWWKELSSIEPKAAKREIISSAKDLYTSEELAGYRFVYATTLHVRKSGNRNAEIIDELYLGRVVRVIEKSRRWTLIEYHDSVAGENKQGWVFTRYLRTFR